MFIYFDNLNKVERTFIVGTRPIAGSSIFRPNDVDWPSSSVDWSLLYRLATESVVWQFCVGRMTLVDEQEPRIFCKCSHCYSWMKLLLAVGGGPVLVNVCTFWLLLVRSFGRLLVPSFVRSSIRLFVGSQCLRLFDCCLLSIVRFNFNSVGGSTALITYTILYKSTITDICSATHNKISSQTFSLSTTTHYLLFI